MNKKLLCYAGVVFLLLFVGSSSALIDLTGTYQEGGTGSTYWNRVGTTLYPATNGNDVQVNGTVNATDVIATDDVYIADKIYHIGDLDTYLYFSNDQMQWIAGNDIVVQFTDTNFMINVEGAMGGKDVDFTVDGVNQANLFHIDAGLKKIGILTHTPDEELDVHGNAIVTGTLNVTGVTNSSGGFATDTGVGWSGTFTATEGVVTVRYGIIIDVDWD